MVVDSKGYVWYLPKFKDPENPDAEPLNLLLEEREDFDLKMHSISCLKGEILRDIPNGKWAVFDTQVFKTPDGDKTMRIVGWKTSKKAS
jgi:hypothetical protein